MRKHYLDNIRWCTIALVVLFHVFYYYNNIGTVAMFTGLPPYTGGVTAAGLYQYMVYPWFMVLLFVVAGISARCALQTRTGRQFLRERVDKLLVPSTLGILAFGWVGGAVIYRHTVLPNAPSGLSLPVRVVIVLGSGTGALWFCQELFLAVLVLLALRRLLAGRGADDAAVCGWFDGLAARPAGRAALLVGTFLVLWGGAQVLNPPVITSYRNGIYIMAFLLGYYLFSQPGVTAALRRGVPLFGALTLGSGAFYIVNCYGLNYADGAVLRRFDLNLYAFFMVLFVLGAAEKFADKSTALTRWLARHSFGVYVFHIPVLLVLNFWLEPLGLPMPLVYGVELAGAVSVSLLLNAVICRVPVLRYWILGIRKDATEKPAKA